MNFVIKEKLPEHLDYAWLSVDNKFIQAIANKLTDEEYHELCHQLHNRKAEYDVIDGEFYEENNSKLALKRKKFRAVKDSLYRGIFAETMEQLESLKSED